MKSHCFINDGDEDWAIAVAACDKEPLSLESNKHEIIARSCVTIDTKE